MAEIDEYFKEAYEALEKLSADEKAKLEYEARDRAIRDYNSQMGSALRRGERRGEQIGLERGLKKGLMEGLQKGIEQGIQQGEESALKRIIESKMKKRMSAEDIAEFLEMDPDAVKKLAGSDK